MLIVLTRLIAKNTRVAYWSLPSLTFEYFISSACSYNNRDKEINNEKEENNIVDSNSRMNHSMAFLSFAFSRKYIYIHIQFSSNVSFKSFKSKSFKIVLWSDSTIHSLYYLSNGVRIQKVQFQPQFPSHRLWHTRKTIHRATNACNNKLPRLT